MPPSPAQRKEGARVTDERTVAKFAATSSSISGNATNLQASLKDLEADIKKDKEGRKEFEIYLISLEEKKKDLQKRIDANKAWIENFEANNSAGSFEAQYKLLLEKITEIYNSAKEFHSQGIDMLIKDFDYHVSYKRWSDTFTGVPFTPK